MIRILFVAVTLVLFGAAALVWSRQRHDRRIDAIRHALAVSPAMDRFDPAAVAGLPEPARRFLLHAIRPGASLARSVTLEMEGRIGLKPGAEKMPFRARQVLSAEGLVWQAWVGRGSMRFSGDDSYADGAGMMRWYLWGVIPIVRAGGEHVTRSAAGRVGLELPAMLPTTLLPAPGIRWEAVDDGTARLHLQVGDETMSPAVSVDAEGRLERVEMMRWDPDAPGGEPGYVRWVGELGEDRAFGGITVPTAVRVTKRAGGPDAHVFFEARFTRVTFNV